MSTKLVIFGITGDLSRRKLLPVLSSLAKTEEFSIVGVSRREVDTAELLSDQPDLIDRTSIFTMDLATAGDYVRLKDFLALSDDDQALIYLSVPPSAAADIVDFLGQASLNTPNVKILFEKPFGFDLASAEDYIERTGQHFSEDQIYRIDHYMAKNIAAEIISLRSNAENHHHHWDKQSIRSIDVVASESIGVEGRAAFYEETGALRDFIQGHLMQLLSLVLMDVPADFAPETLPERRLNALNALALANPANARRAQYEGYQAEVENVGSLTETFASVGLESTADRWAGVELRLTTGKSLNEKKSYIKISYVDGTEDIFEEVSAGQPDAYERVIQEAIKGSKAIFTTSPEVLRSWTLLAPIQEAWNMDNTPLSLYAPGTDASSLIS